MQPLYYYFVKLLQRYLLLTVALVIYKVYILSNADCIVLIAIYDQAQQSISE